LKVSSEETVFLPSAPISFVPIDQTKSAHPNSRRV
jgi:hypothetical protein